MDAHKVLEDPASRRVLDEVALLIGKGGLRVLEGLPEVVLHR